jgi:H3 lysine-79-specific histone-lysine N-methyltransferase
LKAFSEEGSRSLPIVHAADITSGEKAGDFKPAFGSTARHTEAFLQYPSAYAKERYEIMET